MFDFNSGNSRFYAIVSAGCLFGAAVMGGVMLVNGIDGGAQALPVQATQEGGAPEQAATVPANTRPEARAKVEQTALRNLR